MKNFFVKITELFTTVSLAGILIYFLFKLIIGSPEDLKEVSVGLKGVNKSIDTLVGSLDTIKSRNSFIMERMLVIEERQVEQSYKLNETEKLIKKSNFELTKLRKLYGKITEPVYYKEMSVESDSLLIKRYN
jgi:uncharacterized protein YoxC